MPDLDQIEECECDTEHGNQLNSYVVFRVSVEDCSESCVPDIENDHLKTNKVKTLLIENKVALEFISLEGFGNAADDEERVEFGKPAY